MGEAGIVAAGVEGLGEDVPCARCGYNLRTMKEEGRCPECGAGVEESVRAHREGKSAGPLRWMWWAGAVMSALFLMETVRVVHPFVAEPEEVTSGYEWAVWEGVEIGLFLAGMMMLAAAVRTPGMRWGRGEKVVVGLAVVSVAANCVPAVLMELYAAGWLTSRLIMFRIWPSALLAGAVSELVLTVMVWRMMQRFSRSRGAGRLSRWGHVCFGLLTVLSLPDIGYYTLDVLAEFTYNYDWIDDLPRWVHVALGLAGVGQAAAGLGYWPVVAVVARWMWRRGGRR